MKMIDDKTQTFNLLPLITDPLIDYSSVALLLLLPAATCYGRYCATHRVNAPYTLPLKPIRESRPSFIMYTSSVRRRKVKTGNPSHGTSYQGFVHTFESPPPHIYPTPTQNHSQNPSLAYLYDPNNYSHVVAICGVPPEQVPEGVLNFARSYRKQITHVRVLIMNNEQGSDSNSEELIDGNDDDDDDDHSEELDGKVPSQPNTPNRSSHDVAVTSSSRSERPSTSSFMKDAAAILADDASKDYSISPNTLYMVLVSLVTPHAAKLFVQNLNGKPFNSFEKNVIASVYHVIHIEGDESHCSNSNSNSDSNIADGSEYLQQDTIGGNRTSSLLMSPSLSKQMWKSSHSSTTSRHRNRSTSIHSITNEVQNCPVCLEIMDIEPSSNPSTSSKNNVGIIEDSAIFTTVCNHTFHMHCLLQWEDAPCPVCRFDHAGLNETLSQCHICGSTDRVYVCLICGVASCSHGTGSTPRPPAGGLDDAKEIHTNEGCGVYSKDSTDSCGFDALSSGHAKQHYDETLHAYAVDTETQHVWDFAGQGFVHRLIQNIDGKIVEVSDPSNTTSQERSLIPGLTDAEEAEIVHRKLEGYANEYSNLLKGQLEQQRLYFEGVLHQIKREHEVNTVARSPSALIAALKQDLHQLQQRYQTLDKKSNKVSDKIGFLKNMNESLEANKGPMQKEIKTLQQARFEYRDMLETKLPLLEDRVAQLMLKLE